MSDLDTFTDYVVNGGDDLAAVKATVAYSRHAGLTDKEIIDWLCGEAARLNKLLRGASPDDIERIREILEDASTEATGRVWGKLHAALELLGQLATSEKRDTEGSYGGLVLDAFDRLDAGELCASSLERRADKIAGAAPDLAESHRKAAAEIRRLSEKRDNENG